MHPVSMSLGHILLKEGNMFTTVFVPGYKNSLHGHWQERWYQEGKNSHWVEQKDWDNPCCYDWVETLNALLQSIEGPILLVTHSLGGSTVVEWAKKYSANIAGAFIVAVPDVQSDNLPKEIIGYSTPPEEPLPFPSVVLASSNDFYSTLDRAAYFAHTWKSKFINLGELGHVNTDSNIGLWSEGKQLLTDFVKTLELADSDLPV